MTTITIDSAGIFLTLPSYTNPVSIVSGVTVSGNYYGMYGTTQAWTIQNSGLVHGHQGDVGTFAYGIELKAGGNITNTNTGTISATASFATGVYISGGAAAVYNQGTITSNGYGVRVEDSGSVTNAAGGQIYGQQDAIDMFGGRGAIVNDGTINSAGARGINLGTDTGMITNDATGVILGTAAVVLSGVTADVSNAGTIQGAVYGVTVESTDSTITNTGLIIVQGGTGGPAELGLTPAAIETSPGATGLDIDNQATGMIWNLSGNAIYVAGNDTTITNEGLIAALAAGIMVRSSVTDFDLTNAAGATVSGQFGIDVSNGVTGTVAISNVGTVQGQVAGIEIGAAESTITNSGLITSTENAVHYAAITGGTDAAGLVIDNLADGTISSPNGYAIYIQASGATITNQGLITSNGPAVIVAGSLTNVGITNESGATITGIFGAYFGGTDGTITNQGMFGGEAIGIYSGTVASDDTILNQAGGTIEGNVGVKFLGAGLSINNQGLISSQTDVGIYSGHSAANLGVVNGASGTIEGFTGIVALGANAVIANQGEIESTGTAFQPYYNGIYIGGANDTITNSGSIVSAHGQAIYAGDLASAPVISNDAEGVISGYIGVLVAAAGAVITNQGLIESTGTGPVSRAIFTTAEATAAIVTNDAGATISGIYGVYIGGAGSTITNAGTIETAANGHYAVYGGTLATALQVTNAVGGTMSGVGGVGLYAAGVTLTNQGFINSIGTLNDSGVYASSYASSVVIDNFATGSISAVVNGIFAAAANSTITNQGAITGGAGGAGIYVAGIFSTTAASGLQITNDTGATIAGDTGIYLAGAHSTITNEGQILGGSAVYTEGVDLGTYATYAMLDNAVGATISGLTGIYVYGSQDTVTNQGLITGTGLGPHAGIVTGTLAGELNITNDAGGTISGAFGINVEALGDTITNSGYIVGTAYQGIYAGTTGIGSDILNPRLAPAYVNINNLTGGTITATHSPAIEVISANVSNASDALISGLIGIEFLGAATLFNAGTIDGVSGAAVLLQAGGTVENTASGTIAGLYGAFLAGAADILTNAGSISGTSNGIDISGAAGSITNSAGGTISGQEAIAVGSAGDTIANYGLITGLSDGLYITAGSSLVVTNAVDASIVGLFSVNVNGVDGVTVTNEGSILGTASGVGILAITGNDLVVNNEAGAVISGKYGAYFGGSGDIMTNSGQIIGQSLEAIVGDAGATSLVIDNLAGGTLSGGRNGIAASGTNTTITNDGQILGGSANYDAGVLFTGTASYSAISNGVDGTISGAVGIYIDAGHDTITNQGNISGSGAAPLAGILSGTLAGYLNITNDAGGTISGALGINIESLGGTITNSGYITGTAALSGGGIYAGTAGVGLEVVDPKPTAPDVYIYNETGGTISAQGEAIQVISASIINAVGGLISSDNGGIEFSGAGMLSNAGSISGEGSDGVALLAGGTVENAASGRIVGIRGIYLGGAGAGDILVNAGTIIGGNYSVVAVNSDTITNAAGGYMLGDGGGVYLNGTMTNAGTIVGLGGTSVLLSNDVANRLIVDPGAVFTGLVNGGTGGSALELAAGGIGTLDGLGVSFTNFASVTVDAGAAWFITGDADTLGVGSTLAINGLTDLTGANLQDAGAVVNSYLFEVQNSTLSVAGISGTGISQLGDRSTMSIAGSVGAGQTLEFAASVTGAWLRLGTGADMAGTIANFAAGDTIDVADLGFTGESTATVTGNVMTVTNGTLTDYFATSGLADGTEITSLFDGVAGTDLVLGGGSVPPPADLTLAPGSDSGVAGDDITKDTTPTITGTGIAGDTVTLYDGSTVVGTGSVMQDGTWSIVTSTLSAGVQILTATQSLGSGTASPHSSALTLTIDTTIPPPPAALTLAPGSDTGVLGDDVTKDTTPVITGTGIAGDSIILYDGASVVGTGTVASNGTWAIQTSTLSAGAQVLTATQSDVADNVSGPSSALTLTIDTTIPPPPAALALSPGSDTGVLGDDITKDTTPVITGTGIAGDKIILYDGESVVGTGTVASNGTWAIQTSTLTDGVQILVATQSDVADNVSGPSSALTLTIDTTIPTPPAALTLAPPSDSGVAGDDITDQDTPVITGTGVAGDTITLYDGQTIVGYATVASNGTWSAATTPLALGLNELTATQANVAGDVSPASAALGLTIVPVPTVPTVTDPSTSTQPGEPVLAGAAPDNSLVSLYQDGNLVGTARATPSGAWSFNYTSPLSAGTYLITATATDAAGDVSAVSDPLTLQVSSSGGYTVFLPPNQAGNVVSRIHDNTGLLLEVDTRNATQQLLQSVTNSEAILEIYDSSGKLIGTVTQASSSADSQPAFFTERETLSAITGSGPVGSVIDFLSESNEITSQGNDTVIAGPGADTIFAAGPTCSVIGGSGTLLYVGGAGSTTVTGGTGSSTVFGGGGGGQIDGGAAGDNVLVAGGGATTVLGGGAHDVLVGGSGTAVLAMNDDGIAFGGTGHNTVFGADGGILVAGPGANTLIGGTGNEALWGGSGSSTLFGGTGAETLGGGAGNTTLLGGTGNTIFVGASGNSTIWGGSGDSTVFGGSGAERVHLGSGVNQVLFGGGSMSITGGAGTDLYDMTFGNTSGSNDMIAGFKVGTDQLRLFGYSPQDVQETVSGGSTIFSLDDGTTLTLVGVTTLSSSSVVFG